MVTHKLVVLSIGQKTREIKRATRTRGTRVSEHLDATTAPIRRRGVVAFTARRICAAAARLDGDYSSRLQASIRKATITSRLTCGHSAYPAASFAITSVAPQLLATNS